jgi:hypothetical protein
MALQCDVTTSDGLVVTGAYIRPKFEVRKKVSLNDDGEATKVAYLFVECEVFVSEATSNIVPQMKLQVPDVDRFKGAWDVDGGGLEAQGYALMKAQAALTDATDV